MKSFRLTQMAHLSTCVAGRMYPIQDISNTSSFCTPRALTGAVTKKRQMLQRIYATAFFSGEELEAHLHRLEEAKRRDHRHLAQQLDLYSVDQRIGPGLILWHSARRGGSQRNRELRTRSHSAAWL